MLTPKQERFCEEYLVDLNATQAAIRAGYSEDSARQIASDLLAKHDIQDKISELRKILSEQTGITVQRVLNELAKVGFSNIQDFIEPGNTFKDATKIDADKAAALESIKVIVTEWEGGTKTSTQFKLYDKISALEKLGRHLGIFEKDNEQGRIKIIVTNTPEEDNA